MHKATIPIPSSFLLVTDSPRKTTPRTIAQDEIHLDQGGDQGDIHLLERLEHGQARRAEQNPAQGGDPKDDPVQLVLFMNMQRRG